MTNQSKPRYYGDPNMLIPLEDSEILSTRAKKALHDDGVLFLADLLQKTEAELLRTRNFGRKCLAEVKQYLGSGPIEYVFD